MTAQNKSFENELRAKHEKILKSKAESLEDFTNKMKNLPVHVS